MHPCIQYFRDQNGHASRKLPFASAAAFLSSVVNVGTLSGCSVATQICSSWCAMMAASKCFSLEVLAGEGAVLPDDVASYIFWDCKGITESGSGSTYLLCKYLDNFLQLMTTGTAMLRLLSDLCSYNFAQRVSVTHSSCILMENT
jgi:hypothetical protein